MVMYPAWTEIIGIVEEVDKDSLRIKVAYTIRVPEDELAKWAAKLHRGSRVGILVLHDGSIRVRGLNEEVADRDQG